MTLVKNALAKLSGTSKQAEDLAAMLDNPIFAIDKYGENVDAREILFNVFCALFVQHGVEPPLREEGIWRARLRRPDPQALESGKKNLAALKRCLPLAAKKNPKVRTLLQMLALFPDLCAHASWSGLRFSEVIAEINRVLFENLGFGTMKPDYAKITTPVLLDVRPSRPITIALVDDSVAELANSRMAVTGIPNVTLAFYHHIPYHDRDEKAPIMARVAEAVVAMKPDIVLMDEGLGEIIGHDLVEKIRAQGYCGLFIANTGGDPKDLHNVGCYDNFEKGHSPRGVINAIAAIR